jgi:hypothetical protein
VVALWRLALARDSELWGVDAAARWQFSVRAMDLTRATSEVWLRPCGGEAVSITQVGSTAIAHPRTHLRSSSVNRGMSSSLAAW